MGPRAGLLRIRKRYDHAQPSKADGDRVFLVSALILHWSSFGRFAAAKSRLPFAWEYVSLRGDVGDGVFLFCRGLSWSTTDRDLRDAFEKIGNLTEARVVKDKYSGRSRGFGFVTFSDQRAVEDAIEEMNGMDLDGRSILVEKAQPQASGRDRDSTRDYDRRGSGGGRGSGSRECFQCGKPGHFARECPSGDGGRGDRYGDRDDRYARGGSGNGHYGPDRNGDHYGGRNRDSGGRGGPGNDRYSRDRSGPYERPSGGYRS